MQQAQALPDRGGSDPARFPGTMKLFKALVPEAIDHISTVALPDS